MEKVCFRCFSPIDQANRLHIVVVSHYTHYNKNGMLDQRGEGCKNAQKQIIIKAH